jgi:hypothetical protein
MQRPHASSAPIASRTWLVLATQAVQAGPAERTMPLALSSSSVSPSKWEKQKWTLPGSRADRAGR